MSATVAPDARTDGTTARQSHGGAPPARRRRGSRRPPRAWVIHLTLALALIAFFGLITQQYVSAHAELDRSRVTLARARRTLASTQRTRAEQDATARAARVQARLTSRQVAAVVTARRAIQLAVAQVQSQLSGTNELIANAAKALFSVTGASNVVSECLDGVTQATQAISAGNDNRALQALRSAAGACDKTLVANDANVACARGPLISPEALQWFFGLRGDLWAGADLTSVVPLPDGRNLWLFGDTFYTPVKQDGSRDTSVAFGHNSAFVQSGGCMRHISGSGSGRSWLAPPQTDGSAYWPMGGVVVGNKVHIFLGRIAPEAPFGRLLDRAVATLSLPDLQVVRVTPLGFGPADPGWGTSAVAPGDGFVYLYGARRDVVCGFCFATAMYVARAPVGSLTDTATWTYWDGATWSANRDAARGLLSGSGSQIDVRPWRGGYLAVSKAGDIATPDIVGWWSASPLGPWIPLGPLYRIPPIAHADANIYTYMPSVVPRAGAGRLVIAYNVGSLSDQRSQRDAQLYGPRFVAVDVPTATGMR